MSQSHCISEVMNLRILLYVPNLIGYMRLVLLAFSWLTYYTHCVTSAALYLTSILLDGVDGYMARKLNQVSQFGAWFDIILDIIARGMLWSRLYSFGYLVAVVEWMAFVCTHHLGANWKHAFSAAPFAVRHVMKNNFKSVWGFVAVGSLHGLPLWLYCFETRVLSQLCVPFCLQLVGIVALLAGRGLCMTVELWLIWSHIADMLCEKTTINCHQ